jgi:hypothetical protein
MPSTTDDHHTQGVLAALTAKTETKDGLAEKQHADEELSPIMNYIETGVLRSSQRRWF